MVGQAIKESVKPIVYAAIGAGLALTAKYGIEKGVAWYQKRKAEKAASNKQH